jgi:hypothetical protein
MFVRGIDWQTAPASGTAKTPPKGARWCKCEGGRQVFCPQGWSCGDCCDVVLKAFEARTLLPRDRDYGPVLVFEVKQTQGRFLDPTERMFKKRLSEIDGILSQAGLQRVSGRKKATRSNLFSSGQSPAQSKQSPAWLKMRRVIAHTGGFAGQRLVECTDVMTLSKTLFSAGWSLGKRLPTARKQRKEQIFLQKVC